MSTDNNDDEQLAEDLTAIAAWGDPDQLPDPTMLISAVLPVATEQTPSRTRHRLLVAAAVVALIAAVGLLAVVTSDGESDNLRTADGTTVTPSRPFECGDLGTFLRAFSNSGGTYDYDPSTSLDDLTSSVDRVVRGTLVGVREAPAEEVVVFELQSIDGESLEFARWYNPAEIEFSDLEAAFMPGIPTVVFLRETVGVWRYVPALEGFFVSCAGDQAPLSVGIGPTLWSAGTELDALLPIDESDAEETFAADCVTDAGPDALVAIDAATGDELWTRLVGQTRSVTVANGVIQVDATHHASTVDSLNGDVLSCSVQTSQAIDVQAVPTSIGPRPTEPPPLVVAGTNEWWELSIARAGTGVQQLLRIVVVDRVSDAVVWDAVVPGFEVFLLGDLVVSIDQTGGTGTFNVNVEGDFVDTRVTAYAAASGERLWQVALPGTPVQAVTAGESIVVPSGTELFALDPETGNIDWQADLGSPGQGGVYTEPGLIRDAVLDEDTGILIAVAHASELYID